jgi:hippurate hydrolase
LKNMLWLAAAVMSASTPLSAATLQESIRADMPMLLELYRDLHAHPELSMDEVRTPALMAPKMRQLGFDVTEHVGKTGLVAVMKNGAGPVLLIRADMDALRSRSRLTSPSPPRPLGGFPTAAKLLLCMPAGTTPISRPGLQRPGVSHR